MKRLFTVFALFALVGCQMVDDAFEEIQNAFTEAVVENFEKELPVDTGFKLGYTSDYLDFEYFKNEEYGYWGGFAHSMIINMMDGSYENQYSAYNSAAASGEGYLVYYYDSFNEPCDILCRYFGEYHFTTVRLNLTTYTYKSITEEESNTFARVFTDGDYMKVRFTALLEDKQEGDSVDCYVVDFRDGKRFFANEWTNFDISALSGDLWGIRVTIETTDVGEWGANTPLYICMDDLTYTVSLL